jgi:hypothetical protein
VGRISKENVVARSGAGCASGTKTQHLFHSPDADNLQTATAAPTTATASIAVHELAPNSEWRFEVAINSRIDVKVRIHLGMPEVS